MSASVKVDGKRATIRCPFCQKWNRVDLARAEDRPRCGSCGKPLLLDRPLALDNETFARTIAESDVPVVVDFYADWCGPCKVMAPVVDRFAASRQGELLVAKLNTDLNQSLAQQFDVRGIPTVIVFRDGKEVRRQSGALPLTALEAMVA